MKLKAVDLFCGAGGASTGLVRACDKLGIELDLLAINHWPTAVQTHLLNHPGVRHMCEAVEKIDPRAEIPGGRLHLLLAGPECTHFSTARGGRPVNPQSRASAWHIAKWAQELYIDTILIENVPEFRTWGPIGADFKPLKSKKGETFKAFLEVLKSLGYKVEVKILNAADFGDPTTRQRLFILARRGKHQINWPEATHSKTGSATLFGGRKRWKAAREIIDWTIPGKSIFNRKKPLRPATIARIFAGLDKYGGEDLKPFLVILRNNQDAQSIDGPVPTLTTSGANVGLAEPVMGAVGPFIIPVNHGAGDTRSNSIDGPLPTLTARANQYLVEPMVLGQQSGSAGRPVSQPIPTVATDGAIALVEPFMVPMYGERDGQQPRTHSVDQPVPVIPATGGGKFGVVEPCIVQTNERRDERVQSVDEPLKTITAAGGRYFGVVEPFIVDAAFGGGNETRRQSSIDEPIGTLPTSNRFAVAEASLVAMEHGGRALSVDNPIPTITTARGGAIGVAEAFVVSAGGANLRQPRTVDEPVPTVMGSDRLAVVEPVITSYYGTTNVSAVADPLPTVTTKDRFGVAQPFIVPNNTNNVPKSVDEPLSTVTGANRLALVQPVINGLALDIRFRMLQPHELAAAMSFPKSYQFSGKREDVVKQIGNSWPGELSFALNLAIAKDYAQKRAKKSERVA